MQAVAERCWSCDQPTNEALFCPHCNSLQRPASDYYRLFGLEPRLEIDPDDLQKRFYALSRRLHPDRFTRANATEQQYSLEATSILNDAYRALRDPLARAEYVLKLHGFDIGEQRSKDVPPELLEEVFEWNMALEELKAGDESVKPQLDEARQKFLGLLAESDAELAELFRKYDATPGRGVLAEIRALLNRRRYINNLVA